MTRYYSTQRPVQPGSFPKPSKNRILQTINFPARTYVEEIHKNAWGYIDYKEPLTIRDEENYELVPVITDDYLQFHQNESIANA